MKAKKWTALFLSLILCIVMLSGCASDETAKQEAEDGVTTYSGETTYPVTIKDMTGDVTIEKKPEKIVSVSPANTETLFAIGAGERVVGRTDYCTYPEEALTVESIGSYSPPNVEKILSLSPDLVVFSDYVDDSVRSQIEATGATVLVYNPGTITEVENYIVSLGQAVDENDGAKETVTTMQSELNELLTALTAKKAEKSVFLDIGDYWTPGSDTLINNEFDVIGAENIAADAGSGYVQISTEQIIADNPDVYISTLTPIDTLKKVAGFDKISAFENNEVYVIESGSADDDMIKRPGPRLVEGMRILAEKIYPECFDE